SDLAAPGLTGDVPAHLRPHALVATGSGAVATALALSGDAWAGIAETDSQTVTGVEIHVPGVGPAVAEPSETQPRRTQPRETGSIEADRKSGVQGTQRDPG